MRNGFATLHMLHARRTGSIENDQVTGTRAGTEPEPLDAPLSAPTPLHTGERQHRTGRGRYRRRTPERDAA